MKRIALLGGTGSIGTSTLEVITALPERLSLYAVTGHGNLKLLSEIVRRFRPAVVGVTGGVGDLALVKEAAAGCGARVVCGAEGLVEIAGLAEVDAVVAAVVGAAGLRATLTAAGAGKRVCLANKEALVVGGHLVMGVAGKSGAEMLPVDSEHSAIFQAMLGGRRGEVAKVVLTASGGPFRGWGRERLAKATVAEALVHPTWAMGQKVTIDSATLFNKALELIEAYHLFGLRPEQLGAVIHPQSVVHSFVEFVDGSVLGQMSPPDMRLPIQYALTHPERAGGPARRFDFLAKHAWEFWPAGGAEFPAIRLAERVMREMAAGNTGVGAVFNAANEVAVEAFLAGPIGFLGIAEVVERVLDAAEFAGVRGGTLAEVEAVDASARRVARGMIEAGV